MQVITPIELTDSMIDNPIAEPDSSVGEVEWEARRYLFSPADTIRRLGAGDGFIATVTGTYGDPVSIYSADDDYSQQTQVTVTNPDTGAGIRAAGVAAHGDNYWVLNDTHKQLIKRNINDASVSAFDLELMDEYIAAATDGTFIYCVANSSTEGTVLLQYTTDGELANQVVVGDGGTSMEDVSMSEDGELIGLFGVADVRKLSADGTIGDVVTFYYNDSATCVGLDSYDGFYFAAINSGSQLAKYYTDGDPANKYEVGTQRIISDEHKLYEAVALTGDKPSVGAALAVATWVVVSATNKWRMFDYLVDIDTAGINQKSTGTQTITLTPGVIASTISFYGLSNVAAISVVCSIDGVDVYESGITSAEIASPPNDWAANGLYYRDKMIFTDLPVDSDSVIRFYFHRSVASAPWECGDVVIGNARTLGKAVYESSTSRKSNDIIKYDDYGNEKITSRPSAEYTTFELVVNPEYDDYVERILKDSLNKRCVYVGDKNSSGGKLFTFGRYEISPNTYKDPSQNTTTLKVRGII